LFADRDAARASSYTRIITGVSYFNSSVKGLEPGSEVTMHGLKIGEVTEVRLTSNREAGKILAKVRYRVQPERVTGLGQRVFKTDDEAMTALLALGLHASLQTSSLITGSQMIAIEFDKDAPATEMVKEDNEYVIPSTEASGFAQLAAAATDVLNKINAMPFSQIGANLNGFLGSLNKATEGPQLKEAVDNLATALASAQRTLNNFNKLAQSADKLTASVDSGYGNDTKFHRDLDRLLVQTDETVRAVRSLADILSRHPEALIKGRPE
jgi:paraquat-inducible protein B